MNDFEWGSEKQIELCSISAKLAMKLENIVDEEMKYKNIEEIFAILTKTFSSMIANFVDRIIIDKCYDRKIELVNSICELSKMILKFRESDREKTN